MSKELISSEPLRRLAARLPFSPDLWPAPLALVGGAVRDALLGRERLPLDLDLVTPAPAIELAGRLAKQLGAGFAPLDPVHEIARVILADGTTLDFARQQGLTLESDLARRDFTINAIAYDLDTGRLVDPFGGCADLRDRQLRALSETNLRDDPLRLLRAYRQAAQLNFAIAPETRAFLVNCAPLLARVSAERVREELVYLLAAESGSDWFALVYEDGLLKDWLPELSAMEAIGPTAYHHLPLVEHTFEVLRQVDRVATEFGVSLDRSLSGQRSERIAVKLAALLHDIAKPRTRRVDPLTGKLLGFPGHDQLGAEMAERILERFKFSREEIRWVTTLVRHHLRPGQLAANYPPGDRAVYRLCRDLGALLPALLVLAQADRRATCGPLVSPMDQERATLLTKELLDRFAAPDDPMAHTRPFVDGRVLMDALGLLPGPQIGRLLVALREAQAVGEVANSDEALDLARKLVLTVDAFPEDRK